MVGLETIAWEEAHRATEMVKRDFFFVYNLSLIVVWCIDYSGGGGSSSSSRGGGFSDTRRQYEEYNAGDDEVTTTPVRSNSMRAPVRKTTAPPPPAPVPVVDLLGDFDNDAPTAPPPAVNKALPAVSNNPVASIDGQFRTITCSTKDSRPLYFR